MAAEWHDLLADIYAEGLVQYSFGAPVATNPSTHAVSGTNKGLTLQMGALTNFGDPGGILPAGTEITRIRMAGIITPSGAASGAASIGNGMLDGGTYPGSIYDTISLSGTTPIVLELLDTEVDPGGAESSAFVLWTDTISPAQNVTFEITQFDVYADIDPGGPDPDPGGPFWTAKVRVTETL